MEKFRELIRHLCMMPGPSGFEKKIAQAMYDYLKPICHEVKQDSIGNIIGVIRGKDMSLPPVVVNAHMDSVGFIVSNIEENGFLRIKGIGTPNEKVLPGSALLIRCFHDEIWLPGIVGTKCAHLQNEADKAKPEALHELYVDIGAANREAVLQGGIDIGAPCVFKPAFSALLGDVVAATSLDNRAGCAALIQSAKRLAETSPERTVYFIVNVWEEHNQRGAALPVDRIKPTAVISLDMLLSGDTADVEGYVNGKLGKGPVVSCFNFCRSCFNGTIAHEGLYALVSQKAKALGIPVQKYVCDNSLGDNAYTQLTESAPAVIEMGAALRYAHSSREAIHLGDVQDLGRLVAETVLGINRSFSQERYKIKG